MKLYAGIDGGQTGTQAVVGDASGAILGRGSAGPADEIGQDAHSTRLRDALEGALARALREAGLPSTARLETVVAGISGYDGRVYGVAPAFNAARVRLLHDTPVAHAGAFGGEAGVVLIVGTGSVAYGVAKDGRDAIAGGWGFLFGDEGSAFGIAREALRTAMYAEDCGKRDEPLLQAARKAFGVTSLRAFVRALYVGEIPRDAAAAFAENVISLAASKERTALEVTVGASLNAAAMARTCARRLRLRAPAVAFVGGLTRSTFYSRLLSKALQKIAPTFTRVEPLRAPVEGALLLALRGGVNEKGEKSR